MNFTLLLLIISLHLMLFETKASKRTHRDVKEDDKHDEISDLGDNIRKRHLNHGCWRRNIKRKVSCFPSPLKHKAVRSRRISKRCFNYSPYDFDIPQVSYPCGGTCWPSGTDPWWPEYGWVDGCGYPPQGGGTWNNECGFPLQGGGPWNNECGYPLQGGGTWNQPPPWFPYGCGKWCFCKGGVEEEGKPTSPSTPSHTGATSTSGTTQASKTGPTSPTGGSHSPTTGTGQSTPTASSTSTATSPTGTTQSTSNTARMYDFSRKFKPKSPTAFAPKNRLKVLNYKMKRMKDGAQRKKHRGEIILIKY